MLKPLLNDRRLVNEDYRRRFADSSMSLTLWFDEAAADAWNAPNSGLPGGQRRYSDLAIVTSLTLRTVFRLALRQTEGFVGSLIRLMDLGLVPGTEVEAEMQSASGDPTAYRIRGSLIALRREQAETIQIERKAEVSNG